MTKENASAYTDTLITDFSSPAFQTAFRRYFQELGITVRDWDGLWREMNGQGDNAAFLRTGQEGAAVGFIQFRPTLFTSWFFQETYGFIREFWVTPEARGMGHGAALLALAESWFLRTASIPPSSPRTPPPAFTCAGDISPHPAVRRKTTTTSSSNTCPGHKSAPARTGRGFCMGDTAHSRISTGRSISMLSGVTRQS